MGFFSSSKKAPAKRAATKVAKCPTCKKSLLACDGHRDGGVKEKEKVRVEGKDGRTRTVTRNTGNTIRDGIVWCACGNRRIDDRCMNATCSSNRGTS